MCFQIIIQMEGQEVSADVLEEGKKPVKAKLEDIYDEIRDRQVIWFSVENGYTFLIKLKED